jgi:hypothetical protein
VKIIVLLINKLWVKATPETRLLVWEILRSRCGTVLPNVLKIIIFMCVLIKYMLGVVKCLYL